MATLIFSILCGALAIGCQSYNPVALRVANSDGVAIAGATAVVAPMYFFNPTDENHLFIGAYEILDPFPAAGDQGITNDAGRVTLQVVSESPLQLNVYADGYSVWSGLISITKQNRTEINQIDSLSQLIVTVD